MRHGLTPRRIAELAAEGGLTPQGAELLPGERRAANGVIIGSGADLDIPRFGADANDMDHLAEG